MGTNYKFDREFTDYVHHNLALYHIYDKLNWKAQTMNRAVNTNVDLNNGVDYFLVDKSSNNIITVQERFRDSYYKNYSDFTIRFEREFNPHEERKLSEYYKLNADYFVYGIINESKFRYRNASGFIKFAVINIEVLKDLINNGLIIIDRNLGGYKCQMINNKMHCPVIYNKDDSSSFFPIDIKLLNIFYKQYNVVILQEGF